MGNRAFSEFPLQRVQQFLVVYILLCIHGASLSAQMNADSVSAEVVEVINKLRANPSSFAPAVDRYVAFWKPFVSNKKALNTAATEAKKRLLSQVPLDSFNIDNGLTQAAKQHAADGAKRGQMGHIGSDKSNPATRAEKFGKYFTIGECITYGQATAERIVMAFIVDENTPDRGHRESMLNPNFKLIGVSYDTHPKYNVQCVVVLGAR